MVEKPARGGRTLRRPPPAGGRRAPRGPPPAPPRHARRLLFDASSRTPESRDTVVTRVASSLGVTPEDLQASLFADLPGERLVAGLPVPLSPAELALRANLGLTQSLLCRATGVILE